MSGETIGGEATTGTVQVTGHQGDEIRGTGLVDLETIAGDARLIGNVLVDCTVDGAIMQPAIRQRPSGCLSIW